MVLVYSSLSMSVFVADLVVCSSNFSMPGACDTDACVENPLVHEDACAYIEGMHGYASREVRVQPTELLPCMRPGTLSAQILPRPGNFFFFDSNGAGNVI